MSLLVTVILNDAIIMASDSRTTFVRNSSVRYEDTTNKTFLFDKTIGISHCRNSHVNGETIEYHLKKFQQLYQGRSITSLANLLRTYFLNLNSSCDVAFLIAGFENNTPYAYRVFTQGSIECLNTSFPCSYWEGERDVPSRLFSDVYIKRGNTYSEHSSYQLAIEYFNISEGIEYAKFIINTAKGAMRFQKTNQTIGGPIDVLVIKPNNAFWFEKK